MRKLFYILTIGLLLGQTSCQKAEYLLFNGVARVQMVEKEEIRADFFYEEPAVLRDTVYLTVQTIGDPVNRTRKIAFEQIPEYDVEYKYDNKGNLVDSVFTKKPNQAIPGVHYVSMDAPEIQSLLVVQPNAVSVEVPVILLRDKSLKKEEYRLCLKLVETSDFLLGEREHITATIVFFDKLSKPGFWNSDVDSYYFGTYSTTKHEFMYNIAKERIDNEWYDRICMDYGELMFFKTKFQTALEEYNNDPDKIAQGLAPLREDPADPASPLILFP